MSFLGRNDVNEEFLVTKLLLRDCGAEAPAS